MVPGVGDRSSGIEGVGNLNPSLAFGFLNLTGASTLYGDLVYLAI